MTLPHLVFGQDGWFGIYQVCVRDTEQKFNHWQNIILTSSKRMKCKFTEYQKNDIIDHYYNQRGFKVGIN